METVLHESACCSLQGPVCAELPELIWLATACYTCTPKNLCQATFLDVFFYLQGPKTWGFLVEVFAAS